MVVYEDIPNLCKEILNEKSMRLKKPFDKLNDVLTEINLNLDYFVVFTDYAYYVLYTYFSDNVEKEVLEVLSIGNNASDKFIGHTSLNLAITNRQFSSVEPFEHLNPIFHSFRGYAEPVIIGGELLGSLALYIKINNIKEDDFTTAEKNSLIGGLLKTIKLLAFEENKVSKPVISKKTSFEGKYYFHDIIYKTEKFKQLIDNAKLISKSNQSILIQGESGTGKELFASAIHNESPRRDEPFVSLNCATLAHNLIESELFGYSEGAFTGALKGGKKGKLELADKGTLFLDEIGDLPLNTQAMLLRVLEEKEFMRIGDEKLTCIDVRIICASNKEIKELCKKGQFRWDLYYRLGGMTLDIPPLRKRKADINLLADYSVDKINLKRGIIKKIDPEVVHLLKKYDWPGNIREFQNILETAHILSQNEYIEGRVVADLLGVSEYAHEHIEGKLNKTKVIKAIKESGGNISKAADILHVSRTTIYRWLKD